MKTNKKAFIAMLTAALALGVVGLAACSSPSNSSSSNAASSSEAANATSDSLYAYHAALNLDWSDVTEVSIDTCTSNSACHKGSWDAVVESTDGLWKGVGQISDANPHDAHGSSGYVCSDCHSLYGTSTNQCNGCHAFDTPSGWVDKDPTTTVYGVATEEPLPTE